MRIPYSLAFPIVVGEIGLKWALGQILTMYIQIIDYYYERITSIKNQNNENFFHVMIVVKFANQNYLKRS